ncbi:hypothetical protein QI097_00495 [Staphylococcus saprophyticus]|nr:hypothetical protein [Staphylococcus saprophyticus]
MAYESIDRLKKYMQKKIDAIVTGEKVTFNINGHQLLDEINETERKAKAFDKVLELHSQHIDTSSIYGSDLPLSANRYEYYDDGLFAYEMYTLIKNYLEDK